jgi:flagellar L-ring protein FlgH
MKFFLSLVAIATYLTVFAQAQDPVENYGSLVPKTYKPIFTTRTARRVGDVLTVIVSEASTGNIQSATNASKKDSNNVDRSSIPLLDFVKVGLLETLTRSGNSAANSTVNGVGSTNQTGRLTARMAVVIKQIMPNGVFVVEGTRAVKINRETQQLVLSGLCRLDDIRLDNTILSENLANAEIKSEGMGLIYERQRRGLITKALDWLF